MERVLRQLGWQTEQALWYRDVESGKARELDVLATLNHTDEETGGIASVSLAVECKRSVDKPWVFFSSASNFAKQQSRPLADRIGQFVLRRLVETEVSLPPLLLTAPRLSHGVVKAYADAAKSGDPTSAYAAARGAVAASESIGLEPLSLLEKFGIHHGHLRIIIPVVVVEGRLYSCSLQEDSVEISLTEVVEDHIVIGTAGASATSLVTVVDSEHLASFVQQHTPMLREFAAGFAPHVRGIVQQLLVLYDRNDGTWSFL